MMKIEPVRVKTQINVPRLTVLGTDVKMNTQDQSDAESVAKTLLAALASDKRPYYLAAYIYAEEQVEQLAQSYLTLTEKHAQLQSENARLREGLEKYSNKDNWDTLHVCDSYSGAVGCLFRLGLIDDSDKEGPDYATEALSHPRSEATTGEGNNKKDVELITQWANEPGDYDEKVMKALEKNEGEKE